MSVTICEAFLRLMDEVHKKAWDQRENPIRSRVLADSITEPTNFSLSKPIVYPWPQYFVELSQDGEEKYELRYPGDPRDVPLTRGNDFFVWPEVEFVEEFFPDLMNSLKLTY